MTADRFSMRAQFIRTNIRTQTNAGILPVDLPVSSTLSSNFEMSNLPASYVEGFHCEEVVKRMKYQPLGRTGMTVSKLSFGKVHNLAE